nr:NAD(P)H-binding protein [Streptomyces sp. NBC_00995]
MTQTEATRTGTTNRRDRVLVTGGTGKTGRRTVARLRELGVETRAASRSGETPFDWADRATWPAALEGVDAVCIVPLDTSPSPTPAFVEQAVAAGVRRLVLLSARGVDVPGCFGSSYEGGHGVDRRDEADSHDREAPVTDAGSRALGRLPRHIADFVRAASAAGAWG